MNLSPKRKALVAQSFRNMFTGKDWNNITVDDNYHDFVDGDLLETFMDENAYRDLIEDLRELVHVGCLQYRVDSSNGFNLTCTMNITRNLDYRKGYNTKPIKIALRRLQVFLNNNKVSSVTHTVSLVEDQIMEFKFVINIPKDQDWGKITGKGYRFMMILMLFKLTFMS